MENQKLRPSQKTKFILSMSIIAIGLITSWFFIDHFVGFESFGELPIGWMIIGADLVAFTIVGFVLKKQMLSGDS